MIEKGYEDFADRWNPILDVFDEVGVRFAHEVHPSEIAYDYWTTKRTLEAIGNRPAFGLNWDPSHFVWQELDPVNFIFDFADRIYHVDCKDAKVRTGDGRRGRLASHLPWADLRRGWDFVSTGHGDVPWEDCFRALNAIGYDGPISIEWEDAGMDRLVGAPGGAAVRPPAGLRRAGRGVRRRLLQQGLTAPDPTDTAEGRSPARPAERPLAAGEGPDRTVRTSCCPCCCRRVGARRRGDADPTPVAVNSVVLPLVVVPELSFSPSLVWLEPVLALGVEPVGLRLSDPGRFLHRRVVQHLAGL